MMGRYFYILYIMAASMIVSAQCFGNEAEKEDASMVSGAIYMHIHFQTGFRRDNVEIMSGGNIIFSGNISTDASTGLAKSVDFTHKLKEEIVLKIGRSIYRISNPYAEGDVYLGIEKYKKGAGFAFSKHAFYYD